MAIHPYPPIAPILRRVARGGAVIESLALFPGVTVDEAFVTRLHQAADTLAARIDRFREARVLVVGDVALDEFLTGQVERLSREAPVLILRHEQTEQVPGGAANAIYNLAKLGAKVRVAGIIGNDDSGRALKRIFNEAGIDTTGMVVDGDRPTVTKTRISGHARQSVTQQIVRVDRKSDDAPAPKLQQALADYVAGAIADVDAVVCSDYGDGALSAPVIAAALEHPLTIVDAQKDLGRYRGATLFTPNLPEAEAAVGYGIASEADLARAGRDLLGRLESQYVLITRGEEGMSLFQGDRDWETVPAFNRTDVFDVTGAGDTVVAALASALVVGASPWEATVLGNLAASIVVRQFGTAATSPDQMKRALAVLVKKLKVES